MAKSKCKHLHTSGLIKAIYWVPEPCYIEKCYDCKKIIKIIKIGLTSKK